MSGLVDDLRSNDWRVNANAAKTIGEMAEQGKDVPEAFPFMTDLLESYFLVVVENTTEAFAKIGESSIPVLIGVLLDENRTFTNSHIILLSHDEMFKDRYEESELKKLIDLLKSRKDYKFSRLKNYP
jgi:HEAT repeat protein